jgi:hypothetical protein
VVLQVTTAQAVQLVAVVVPVVLMVVLLLTMVDPEAPLVVLVEDLDPQVTMVPATTDPVVAVVA